MLLTLRVACNDEEAQKIYLERYRAIIRVSRLFDRYGLDLSLEVVYALLSSNVMSRQELKRIYNIELRMRLTARYEGLD
jgi:hypothetical protein